MTEFERLANHIIGLPPSFPLSCFIFGLSPEIHCEVQALQPISLPQTTALVKLQEGKILDRRRTYKPPPSHHTNPSFSPVTNPNPNPNPNPSHTFVCHTPEEMALQHEKGFYYNWDEKWSSTHKCQGRIFLLIANSNEPVDPPDTLGHNHQTLTYQPPCFNPFHISSSMPFLGYPPLTPFVSTISSNKLASRYSLTVVIPTTSYSLAW